MESEDGANPAIQPGFEEADFEEVRSAGAPFGGAESLPATVQDVVQVEEEMPSSLDWDEGKLTAWLFRPDADPLSLALNEVSNNLDGFLWVDAAGLGARALRELAQRLGIPSSLVDVVLASWQRPRVDLRDDIVLIVATLPRIDVEAHRAFAAEYDLLVGPRFLVTIHRQPAAFVSEIYERARTNAGRLNDGPSFMLYVALDELLGYYAGLIEHVQEEIENIEERALVDTADAFLAEVLQLKRYVYALDHLATQHRPVFTGILRPDFPVDQRDLEPYFRDLDARLADILASFAVAEASVNGAFDIYVSQVSHRTNDVIRTLTLISGILLPVSVILSAFAAFAQVSTTDGSVPALTMLVLAALTIAIAILIFHRSGWLSLRGIRAPRRRRRRKGRSE